MTRIREHIARRLLKSPCAGCRLQIRPGDAYREAVFLRCDWQDHPFVRLTVHVGCIPAVEAGLWRPT